MVGVVDALHEAVGAQYPDDPCTQVLNIYWGNLFVCKYFSVQILFCRFFISYSAYKC